MWSSLSSLVYFSEGWCFVLADDETRVQLEHADRLYYSRRAQAVEAAEMHGLYVARNGNVSADAPEQFQW
jgi:hypothetical protein